MNCNPTPPDEITRLVIQTLAPLRQYAKEQEKPFEFVMLEGVLVQIGGLYASFDETNRERVKSMIAHVFRMYDDPDFVDIGDEDDD